MSELFKISDGNEPNIKSFMKQGKIQMVINIPHTKKTKREETDEYLIRRTAVNYNIPLIVNLELAKAFVRSVIIYNHKAEIKSIDAYFRV